MLIVIAFANVALIFLKEIKVAEEKMQKDFTTFTRWAHYKGLIIIIINNTKIYIFNTYTLVGPKNKTFEAEIVIKHHNCLHGLDVCNCDKVNLVDSTKVSKTSNFIYILSKLVDKNG